ncbi:hypothetical protein ACOMHN_031006 [Nucella lapillus]
MAVTSPVDNDVRAARWFPSWFPWLLFCVTSAVRVYYVLQPMNWWTLHPDEVYQALEVAHGEMYGYGFRAYEYNPPVEIHPDTPTFREQENAHGMNALRSYLLPHAYVMVTWLLELLGLHFTPFVTWKVAHTVAASTLPLAVHRYVRVVFRSHDTACLAAILCAASIHLHVLGTHTLVNSLLSAPVFWALAVIHPLVNPHGDTEGTRNQNDSSAKSLSSGSNHAGQNKASTNGQHSLLLSLKQQSNTAKHRGKHKQQKTAQRQRSAPAANVVTHRGNLDHKNGKATHCDSRDQDNKAENLDVGKNSLLNGDKNHAAYTFPKSCSFTQSESGVENKAEYPPSLLRQKSGLFLQHFLAGFVIAICVYIRVDIVSLVVFALLPFWSPFRTRYLDIIVCLCGSLCGLGVGVMDDFRCYGWGIITPFNWFRFNVQKDYSSILFGKNDFHQYIFEIFCDNVGIMGLSVVCCVSGVLSVFYPLQSLEAYSQDDKRSVGLSLTWRSSTARTCVSWLLLLGLYSSKGHKEMRFAHNVIVLILITWASLLQSGVLRLFSSPKMQKCTLAVGVALFVFNQWREVSHLTEDPKRGGNRMAFKSAGDTQDFNQCLYYLSSREDLTGVFLDRNLYGTGGYTLLHQDVPIFTIFGNNFLEFRKEGRLVEQAKNVFGPQKNITVAYVAMFSNYIVPQHSQYVFKFLLEDPQYNYFVAWTVRDFSAFGLGEPVYWCRTYKVYRRPAKPSKQQKMRMQNAINTPPPSNTTLLLHEADMLTHHGTWERARDRFRLVLKVDPMVVDAYMPLAYCLSQLGDIDAAHDIVGQCYAKFGEERCETTRKPLIDLDF